MPPSDIALQDGQVRRTLDDALSWARERDYAGWDPYDGLNSPLFSPVARNWFLRLVCMHGVNKFPVNLRPLLGVPKQRNPKGVALFAAAYLDRYAVDGDESDRENAERLLEWLERNQSSAFDAPCWGYNFDWQNAEKFFLPAYKPSIVVTVFVGESFLKHYRLTGDEESLATARDVCSFITSEINEVPVDGHTAYAYTPYDDYVVVNANALAAGLLAAVGAETGDDAFVTRADELVDLVVDVQDEKGAWYYSVPGDDSPLSHDNFHTGFVLESLSEYLTVRDSDPAERAYQRGLDFFRDNLFDADGAPRFEHDTALPRDIHGAAQAIRTLALDGDPKSTRLGRRVLSWTLENMLDDEGYFYRRRGRFWDDTTPYMRWNQAWMCYGLGAYLRHVVAGEAVSERSDGVRSQTAPRG
ncbi:prenyltransferase/squalene oxidase repeat-containing protein [Salinigranum rubrum]|uniref:hypothetical protein n=1 Tax=Salinigranum rubrum TaxID=755307 RepID=UPI001C1FB464|nr:hypothetical protein [Salinigranum rubrum]